MARTALLALTLAGCGGEGEAPGVSTTPAPPVTTTIGPDGGSIAGAAATVEVPAGALSNATAGNR